MSGERPDCEMPMTSASDMRGCAPYRLDPFTMLAYQIFEPIHCFRFGNIEFHRRFADVKIHLARCAAHITKIGVGHFARPVYDATHDRNLHPFEVRRRVFDFRRRGLQVK